MRQYLLDQSEQWKRQNNTTNLFVTRVTYSYLLRYCKLTQKTLDRNVSISSGLMTKNLIGGAARSNNACLNNGPNKPGTFLKKLRLQI